MSRHHTAKTTVDGDCPECGRPRHPETAELCTHCRHTIEVAVANVGVYHADLTTVRAGQARYSTQRASPGGGGSGVGMDMRFDATGSGTRLLAETRRIVLATCDLVRFLSPRRYEPVCAAPCLHKSCATVRRAMPPDGSVTGGCRYLLRNSDVVRSMEGAQAALADMLGLERRLARIVDRPPDQWYAGVCSEPLDGGDDGVICEQELYALAREGEVRCPGCGAVHQIGDRRAFLLAAAEDYELTAAEAARAVVALGDYDGTSGQLAARIRKWAERSQIASMRHDWSDPLRPRPLYRIGAILDLLADDAGRREGRRVSA